MLLLNSCTPEPTFGPVQTWLCSINADGTGFRTIKEFDLNFETIMFGDIYMTKDNRIIFYGEKLWISETDTIRPVSITDNIYNLQQQPTRLSQSPDGSKLYFASMDKNIHELDLNTMLSRQLTSESIRTLRNPIVSDLGNYITYTSFTYWTPAKRTELMYWLDLITGESGSISSPDSVSVNPYYSESEDYVYYEKAGLFRSKLDGSNRTTVDNQGGSSYPYTMFSASKDERYIAHLYQADEFYMRVFDKTSGSGVNLPVTELYPNEFLGVMCKDSNRIFYVDSQESQKLCTFNPSTGENRVLLENSENIYIIRFRDIAPTWDGSKVFFCANISIK
jgi:hypothetical protein